TATAAAKAAASSEAPAKATSATTATTEDLADDHAGNQVASHIAGLSALLLAAVVVVIIARTVRGNLGGIGGLAGIINRRANIAVPGVQSLGVQVLGISKRRARTRADDAATGRYDILGCLNLGGDRLNLLSKLLQLARMRGGLLTHGIELFI